MAKILAWTAQNTVVIDTLQREGIYRVKKEYIVAKYGEVANIFLTAYDWFVIKFRHRIEKPGGADYPVWLFHSPLYLNKNKDSHILQVQIDLDKAVAFDREKWNRILNLSYIPVNENDMQSFKRELKKWDIENEHDVFLTNYYPYLKNRIIKSWDRLFDNTCRLSHETQYALWELKRDWIINWPG